MKNEFDSVAANVDFLNASVALADVMTEEQIDPNDPEEKQDFLELFSEYTPMFKAFHAVLLGIDNKYVANTNTPSVSADATPIAKRTCKKMSRLDAENVSRYIAEKCKGRADIEGVINDTFNFINGKFTKKTIRSLIIGKSHSDVSMRFFKFNEGKIIKL